MAGPTTTELRIGAGQLASIVARLVPALNPRAIYLFGSHADGMPTLDSDIDLLITLDDAELARDDEHERGYRAMRGLCLPIELHFAGVSEFERRAGLYGSLEFEVRQHGRLLYGR